MKFPIVGRLAFLAVILGCFLAPPLARGEESLAGRLRLPEGASHAGIEVLVFEGPPTIFYEDNKPLHSTRVSGDGSFELVYTPSEETQIEVVGEGIRRARFSWPSAPNPVLPLEAGSSATLAFADAADGEAVPDVVIGPITPGPEASPEQLLKSYPFFATSDKSGRATITGLIPGLAYEAMAFAPGYERALVRFVPGEEQDVSLNAGGLELKGKVINEGNQTPLAGVSVQLIGEPGFMVHARSGEDGTVSVSGLRPAVYTALPLADGGFEKITEVPLTAETSGTEWLIPVITGIEVSGILADIESGAPVAGAVIEMKDRVVRTDGEGRFSFDEVAGPWPLRLTVEHPEYRFDRDDQSLENYPINGIAGNDLTDILLSMRRERFLVLDLAGTEPPCTGALFLYQLGETSGPVHHPFRECQSVFPLEASGERLAIAVGQNGLVSEQILVYTEMEQTTTTLSLELGAPGRIEAQLRFPDSAETGEYPAYDMELEIPIQTDSIEVRTVSADGAGDAAAGVLAPGKYLVALRGDSDRIFREEEVVVRRGETARIDATVLRGYKLKGTVKSPEGRTLGQIPISLYADDIEGAPLAVKQMTEDDGTFEFAGLGASVDQLRIDHALYRREVLEDISLPSEPLEIVLREKSGVKIRLAGGMVPGAGAEAMLFTCVENQAPGGGSQWFANLDAAEPFAGESEILLLPRSTGRLRAAVLDGGQWDVSEPFDWSGDAESREVVLAPGKTASLRVTVDGLDGEQALDEAEVLLINTTLPEERATTDFAPDSRRRDQLLFNSLPAGDYILMLSDGYGATATETNIAIESGSREQIEITLSGNSAPLRGRVVDGEGDAISGAHVEVMFGDVPEPDVLDDVKTNASGRFTIESLIPDRPYLLRISSGPDTEMYPINVPADPEVIQEFVLEQAIEVEIVFPPQLLQRALARPVVPFMAQPAAGGRMTLFRADSTGAVRVMLRPGDYTILWGEDSLEQITITPRTDRVYLSD